MPGSFVHEQVALRAWRDVLDMRPGTPLHTDALLAGAMGPDPLFMHRLLSPRKHAPVFAWAQRLHTERTSAFLCALCNQARGVDPLVRCYALGFLTHYATDATLHPYVYSQSFDHQGMYRSELHSALEMAMETWLWRMVGNRGTPRELSALSGLGGGEQVRVSQALVSAAQTAFDDAPTPEQVMTSFADSITLSRLSHSRFGIKRDVLALIATPLRLGNMVRTHIPPRRPPTDIDYLHLSRSGWVSPWQPEQARHESVPELLDKAQSRATRYILKALDLWAGKATPGELFMLLGDRGYDSGISWEGSFHLRHGQRLEEVVGQ